MKLGKRELTEFLKPSKVKVAILILLVLIGLVESATPVRVYEDLISLFNHGNPLFLIIGFYWIIILPAFLFQSFNLIGNNIVLRSAIFLVIQFLYLYLISCIITFVIKKIRKKP